MTALVTAKRARPRGFAAWRPRAESLELLEKVRQVLAEYREHLPLTARQIYYRLVASFGLPKTEQAYERLCALLNRARRAGLLDFAAIRDDGVTRLEPAAYSDERDFYATIRHAAEDFRLDRQAGQPVRLWVMAEASGMVPMLARVANPYGVPVLSSGGFDSVTFKHDLAREIADAFQRHEQAVLLHIGDHDPSGVHLFASLAEDVGEMVEALCGQRPVFTRLAVTPEQIERWNLPTAPPKPGDRRAFTGETVQCEAIAPDVLAALVEEAIRARQISWLRHQVENREVDIRRALLKRLGGLA